MFAAVDLGSNSFRLHIGKYENEGIRVIKSARDPIRLAAGIDRNGYLTEIACQTAIDSLTRFRAILRDYSLDAVRVVATNTLRVAKNAHELLPELERAIGYPVEIISGEEEGRLIYMGVAGVLSDPDDERMVIDIGGGSTEVIRGRGSKIRHVESFGIGTVNQSLAFFPDGMITEEAFERAILSARSHAEDAVHLFDFHDGVNVRGSSGTMRAIADTIDKNGMGDGLVTLASLDDLMHRLIDFGHVSNIQLSGMKPDRAGVIMGGLAVLIGLMQEFGIEVVTPVEAGLRMGVMWDLQLRATKLDRRELSVDEFGRRFHVDAVRANNVAETALGFFQLLKPTTDAYARYLHWSGLLHETGLVVSPTGYHKHSAYMIANADMPGFTTREQRLMSTLVLGQKGNLRKISSDMLADADFAKAVLALRLAVMFMHSHIVLDLDKVKLKMKSKIELEVRSDYVKDNSSISFWIQKEQEWWAGIGVDFGVRVAA